MFAGVLLVELVREFLNWCNLQFTQKVSAIYMVHLGHCLVLADACHLATPT